MRWPFRSKSSPSHGGESPAASDDARASTLEVPAFAASVPGNDWSSLPPAPITISARAPRTIAGTPSAIRRPIGQYNRRDVSEFAALGVVDGLARVALSTNPPGARVAPPAPPVGEPSALPTITARSVRAVAASPEIASRSLTAAEAIIAHRAASPPEPAAVPVIRPPIPAADNDDDGHDVVAAPRPSLAQSRRLGLGPGYHGTLPDAMRQERLDRQPAGGSAEPAAFAERVPDDLRTTMRDAYGVDVGDQVVHRGTDVSDEARQLGAVAFAREGEVFVPIEAGPLDEAPAKSLLAHELTHVAQQRRRTAPLPAEGSAEGLALEAEAQRAERFVRGDAGAPAPGPMTAHTPYDANPVELAETQRFVNELVHRGVAEPDGSGGVRFLWGHGAGGRVQRATEPAGAAAQQENWDFGATFGHTLGEGIAGQFEDMIGGEFSFATGFEEQIAADRDAREREFRREQTKEAFHRLRLEHLRVATPPATAGHEITEEQERELAKSVDEEMRLRTDALEARVKTQLEHVNEQLKQAEKPPLEHLDPDRYDAIFNKLFADPDGAMPADEKPEDVKAHADQVVSKANAKQAAGGPPKPGGQPPGGAAAPGGTPAGGGMPAGPHAPGGAPTGGTQPGIDSFGALKGAFVTDLVTLDAGEFGITLSNDELKNLYDPAAAAKTTPTKPADATAPAGAPGPHAAPQDKTHVGPSGHEKIDLDRLDLEELMKRLFPRLRTSLRQELMVDRERAGRLNH